MQNKMKISSGLFFFLLSIFMQAQTLPGVVSGKIERIENFQSRFVDARNIDVWLPENYDPHKKYAVLYMHDGQMLYDSSNNWNKSSWDVDDVVSKLLEENKIRNVIVIGIWNGGKTRHADYFPQKPFQSLSQTQKDSVYKAIRTNGTSVFNDYKVHSDNYLKFLVTELKPLIDKKYSTYTGRKHTFIAGSSMGGLISIYAICEYPEVFGGAACLSTHWPGIFTMENNPLPDAIIHYLGKHLPNPKTHRIYFDYGDQTLDAMYPPLQKRVDEVIKDRGYTEKNWETHYFPGKDHSEKAWNERLEIPMEFLLKK
jgi:predicted alpha/beta superfamily hydrolase